MAAIRKKKLNVGLL